MNRPRLIPLALAAACYVLALVQRPGDVVADTKLDLYVDPRGFLSEVASAWTEQVQLGHVFGGQYGGYLFPMAPWFALGDVAGLPTWLVHRLWLGTLLALAAWGVVRLMDALLDRARGAPHVAAALIFVLNPYVTVYANRTSISLLAYAALPWLLLAVHRGLREPRSWRWPALFALVLTCTGGGVNLAVTGWVLVGPLLFIVYERVYGGVGPKQIWPFLLRLAPVTILANVWWLAPALVHLRYGLDFLPFTEQPGTIWQTTSVTESLRLMGFWTSYIGGGFGGELRPFASHAPALLFHPLVLVASLLIPALTLGGFAWTRRWRYGPWFLILGLTGLAIMVTGFPEGTPLRKAFTFTYNHAEPLRFLRTTYKAGPLLALALAGLGGALAGVAWDRARTTVLRGGVVAVTLGVCAIAAWPLTSGRAPERQLVFDVPQHWHDAADEVERMPAGRRAMVLPGRLFAYYDWGGTIDPILPSLSERPVAERMIVPFADLRSVDLQFTTDALVNQERALPGQLSPLLRLMGVGSVVSNADDDRARSGAIGPVEAEDVLERQEGLGEPRPLGPVERERAAAGRVAPDRDLPRVAVRDVAQPGAMVSVLPRGPLTVLDGSAEGVAAYAAFGGLDTPKPLAYAADLDAGAIRRAAADGGEVVITDSNRRQAFVAARMRANRGPVLLPTQSLSEDGAMLDPFDLGPDAQTVARLDGEGGVAEIFAPASPQTAQLPEHRPSAAFDGDPQTMWLADRALSEDRHWVEIRFAEPRDLGTVEVLPYGDERGRPTVLDVGGRRVQVGDGWARVAVNRKGVRALRIAIAAATEPFGGTGGAGGIAEVRIPGVAVRESLRPPVLAEKALAGRPVAGGLTYLLSRVTTDAPGRSSDVVGLPQSHLLRDRTDPEPRLIRTIAPPVARDWTLDAWTRPAAATEDRALDRLAGTTGTARVSSSGREGGLAAHRGSRALDGDRGTAWVAPWVDPDGSGPRRPGATLDVQLDREVEVRRLRLVAPDVTVRRPTRVRVRLDGGTTAVTAAVAADGTVALPQTLRAQRFVVEVLQARFPAGTSGVERRRRAVGIAEIEGIPGARVADAPGTSTLRGRCGDARVRTAAGVVPLRAEGAVVALENGDALRAVACGEPVPLRAGEQRIEGLDAALDVDHLRLRAAGEPAATTGTPAATAAGQVLDTGDEGDGSRTGVRVRVDEPGWLVLGDSISAGWKATCDGDDLGAPVPMQGFANAWEVEPGCTDVDFTWAPNRTLGPAYLVSLVTSLALLALLALTARRERERDVPAGTAGALVAARLPFPDSDPPRPWPWSRALAAGAAAALVVGFVFALRAGVVAFPFVVLVLRLAVPARTLALAGGALLATVVPLLYVLDPGPDPGGYNSNLAVDRIAAHWVGVAAVLLLVGALARTLAAAHRERGGAGRGLRD